jgi:hypothetical protein
MIRCGSGNISIFPSADALPTRWAANSPKYYSQMRDPFISLMAAGAVTKNL